MRKHNIEFMAAVTMLLVAATLTVVSMVMVDDGWSVMSWQVIVMSGFATLASLLSFVFLLDPLDRWLNARRLWSSKRE